mgnify:CR=1 FL=1
MQYPRSVILDMDEVLVQYSLPFGVYFCKKYGLPPPNSAGPDSFNMSKWLGADKDLIQEEILIFNSGEIDDFATPPPVPGAVAGVKYLLDRGASLHVVTSSAKTPRAKAMRKNTLDTVFGNGAFASVNVLELGADKGGILASFEPAIYVDDLMKNVLTGQSLGHTSVLMRAAHNSILFQTGEGLPEHAVQDWRDLISRIERGALEPPAPQFAQINIA